MKAEAPKPTPFEKFEDLLRKIVHVPKKEVDEREAKREKRNGKS